MVGRLEGKVAIVSGGAQGFGYGITKKFVQEGAKVVILDINEQGVSKVAAEFGKAATYVVGDVGKREPWEKALSTALDKFGKLDIVVNNAGILIVKLVTEFKEEEFDRLFHVNVKSLFQSAQVCIPYMVEHGGGVFVNTSSSGNPRPRPEGSWYGATKAALTNATKALATEWAKQNIRFNTVAPSLAATGLLPTILAQAGMEDTPENRAKMTGVIPLGRMCDPADVGNAVAFLASDEASYITGAELAVDGGRSV